MILSAEHISKSFGDHSVLRDVSVSIEDNDRIGFVGVNGAGKSTFLDILTGALAPDEGHVDRAEKARIGFLRQTGGLDADGSIYEAMREVFQPLLQLQQSLHEMEHQMAELSTDAPGYEQLAQDYALKQQYFENADGYLIDVKIRTVLAGMGFADRDPNTLVGTLSGGEKTRLALARLLLEEPQLLILDEPTNHLDFRTLMWLEEYLQSYKGAILVVSHDRYFLDKVVSKMWELELEQLSEYRGNYTRFRQLKEEKEKRQLKEYELQQEQIRSMEDFIARNIVRATTTKRAQSRRAALEKLERVERPESYNKRAHIHFEQAQEPVKDVLDVSDLTVEVGDGEDHRVLFAGIDLHVFRGEKIAIIGTNGAGKTSFLKTLQGIIPHSKGHIEWGRNVKRAYYEQENTSFDPGKTVLDEFWDRDRRMTMNEARGKLGAMLLSGEDVYKRTAVLSGGERARLAMCILMHQKANLLILDEPTNHLDLNTKEELERALCEFEGTILMVSHDRYLLNRVPSKIIEFKQNSMQVYEGNFDHYLAVSSQQKEEEPAFDARPAKRVAAPKDPQEKVYYRSREQKAQEAKQRQRVKWLEDRIAELDEQIASLEGEIAQPEVFGDYQLMQQKCDELEQARNEQDACYEEWAELSAD